MELRSLLENVAYTVSSGSDCAEITGIARDNRLAQPGDLFICTVGARFDTHDEAVVKDLILRGVTTFVAERDLGVNDPAVNVLLVENTRKAGAMIYASWYGHPADQLTLIAVTGSKGKTTAAHMMRDVLRASGRNPGIIGSNGAEYNDTWEEIANTTPDYDALHAYFRKMADAGCDSCVVEVSSQAMLKSRIEGITFDYGIWLNLQEGDHIGPNEHESFFDYLRCKAKILAQCDTVAVNGDDVYVHSTLHQVKKARAIGQGEQRIIRFGVRPVDDLMAENVEEVFDEAKQRPGMAFTAVSGGLRRRFQISFPGDVQVMNALAVIAVADAIGIPEEAIRLGLSDVRIRGREEIVYRGDFTVCVDFAHNGASAFWHLKAVRSYRPKRVVCIFGADGNRSVDRRYGMGEAAGRLADLAIVTSGHNRFETFEAILADTEVGLKRAPDPHYIAIKDREEAIRYAIDHAEPGDFITILGLGHEHWQEEAGRKRVYNDSDYVRSVLREKGLIE